MSGDVTVNVNVEAEDIERMVVQAILDSALGKRIKAGIDTNLERWKDAWNSPVQDEVDKAIRAVVREVLERDHMDAIKKQVTEWVSEESVSKIITTLWEKLNRGY